MQNELNNGKHEHTLNYDQTTNMNCSQYKSTNRENLRKLQRTNNSPNNSEIMPCILSTCIYICGSNDYKNMKILLLFFLLKRKNIKHVLTMKTRDMTAVILLFPQL